MKSGWKPNSQHSLVASPQQIKRRYLYLQYKVNKLITHSIYGLCITQIIIFDA